MTGRRPLKISVLHNLCPTAAEPYRGAPIWATLQAMQSEAELTVCCSLPDYPALLRRLVPARSSVEFPSPSDITRAPMKAESVSFFALPGVTRNWAGDLLYRSFRRALADQRPDVVLSYWLYPDGYAAVRAAGEAGIPCVIGARGSDLKRLSPGTAIAAKTAAALRSASAVLCVSEDLARDAIRLGAPESRVHAVRNGVDTATFRPLDLPPAREALGAPGETQLVVYVGRLVAAKGLRQLVTALAELRRTGGNWTLALIGKGVLEAELRRMAESLGISRHVLFLGARTPAEIARWLNSADLFCLPSESEGCPNVVLEALACGLPVVATAVGGIPELLDDGCGVTIPDNSAEALAKALREAAAREWTPRAIASRHARSWERVAAETAAICRAALAKSRAPAQDDWKRS